MTWRNIYSLLLRLHPAEFREAYRDEMLWIFDEEVEARRPYRLVWDALISLLRQQVLRPGPAPYFAVADGEQPFQMLEEASLSRARIVSGVITAGILFVLVFAEVVEHGGYPGMLRVPTIYTYQMPRPQNFDIDRWRLSGLDMDSDGWISLTERSAESALRWEPLLAKVRADAEGQIAVADVLSQFESGLRR